MTKEKFESWLISNDWWDNIYEYNFHNENRILKPNKELIEKGVKSYTKTPRNGGEKVVSIYLVESVENKIILHINGIIGQVQLFEHRFEVHQENGDVLEISQYMKV